MIGESEVVQEWIDEGIQQGMQQGTLQTAREAVLSALEVRFDLIPSEIVRAINGMDDPFVLKALLKKAITVPSLDEFKKSLQTTQK